MILRRKQPQQDEERESHKKMSTSEVMSVVEDVNKNQYHLDPKTLAKLKDDLHELIHRHSTTYDLGNEKQGIYLCDESNPIQFRKIDTIDAERFIGLVEKYGIYLRDLITHLNYDSETEFVESKSIVGNVDIERTRAHWANQSSKDTVVCTVYRKNLYTPENLFLGALLLAIRDVAKDFLEKMQGDDVLQKFQVQMESVEKFSNFLVQLLFQSFNKHLMHYSKSKI